jgi:hypothetical protein
MLQLLTTFEHTLEHRLRLLCHGTAAADRLQKHLSDFVAADFIDQAVKCVFDRREVF